MATCQTPFHLQLQDYHCIVWRAALFYNTVYIVTVKSFAPWVWTLIFNILFAFCFWYLLTTDISRPSFFQLHWPRHKTYTLLEQRWLCEKWWTYFTLAPHAGWHSALREMKLQNETFGWIVVKFGIQCLFIYCCAKIRSNLQLVQYFGLYSNTYKTNDIPISLSSTLCLMFAEQLHNNLVCSSVCILPWKQLIKVEIWQHLPK